jgi:hypothetical protein
MNRIKNSVLLAVVFISSCTQVFAQKVGETSSRSDFQNWIEVHSPEGSCKAIFPRKPDHMQQDMKMRGTEEKLRYDVYVADHQRKEVFMVLIAKYPGEVKKEDAKHNLEHFLNTLISQNAKNRLLFADLIEVNGKPALDFFIKTDSVYFKGRAIQANNSLYLLAMECEIKNYQEHHFNYFIKSFSIDN